ncbi:Uncharacterised protein [Vibrio cholerae]|uniref:Uncharacterized protein n=1 Tax=Vibrio cholerae TaxID=666 RepID=A0A655WJB4_VIBCL|nr:Uncharacterised protein [Vibrio cholerae]CSB92315.1 Uncharacterised protein [Vibrio cholerae]
MISAFDSFCNAESSKSNNVPEPNLATWKAIEDALAEVEAKFTFKNSSTGNSSSANNPFCHKLLSMLPPTEWLPLVDITPQRTPSSSKLPSLTVTIRASI